MNKSTTHDSMVDNQTSLRDALQKTFNDNNNNQTSFDLSFSMDDDSSSRGSAFENSSDENKENIKKHSSDEIIESIIENKDFTEDMNYM